MKEKRDEPSLSLCLRACAKKKPRLLFTPLNLDPQPRPKPTTDPTDSACLPTAAPSLRDPQAPAPPLDALHPSSAAHDHAPGRLARPGAPEAEGRRRRARSGARRRRSCFFRHPRGPLPAGRGEAPGRAGLGQGHPGAGRGVHGRENGSDCCFCRRQQRRGRRRGRRRNLVRPQAAPAAPRAAAAQPLRDSRGDRHRQPDRARDHPRRPCARGDEPERCRRRQRPRGGPGLDVLAQVPPDGGPAPLLLFQGCCFFHGCCCC